MQCIGCCVSHKEEGEKKKTKLNQTAEGKEGTVWKDEWEDSNPNSQLLNLFPCSSNKLHFLC